MWPDLSKAALDASGCRLLGRRVTLEETLLGLDKRRALWQTWPDLKDD